jgi:hypothetical protein
MAKNPGEHFDAKEAQERFESALASRTLDGNLNALNYFVSTRSIRAISL